MNQIQRNQKNTAARRRRTRAHLKAISVRPRLHVFRSNRFVYAQVIDDAKGVTLAAASEKELKATGTKTEKAQKVGELLAEKAKKAKVTEVKFDRGAYKYHGRIKALAEAARKGGLVF